MNIVISFRNQKPPHAFQVRLQSCPKEGGSLQFHFPKSKQHKPPKEEASFQFHFRKSNINQGRVSCSNGKEELFPVIVVLKNLQIPIKGKRTQSYIRKTQVFLQCQSI